MSQCSPQAACAEKPTAAEMAAAAVLFDHFCSSGTLKQTLAIHREICNLLHIRPCRLPDYYPKLKHGLSKSWRAKQLFKMLDARANHKEYGGGRSCHRNKVLIIGAGPAGLRASIECQLLGAKVVVLEKRDRFSRNNVLHLWKFVIHDLRLLGAKFFYGKFCVGSIDHVSIRQLQGILIKVALLYGVEFHEGVSFEKLLEPTITEHSEVLGWRALVSPENHPLSKYEFDALIGADGKRSTLEGFKRYQSRAKLALAITANFINRHTQEEALVEELSGMSFVFHQEFFKNLDMETGCSLENIVYYKDETHYFVMTAHKHSLLKKGVLLRNYDEISRLLSAANVDRAALLKYAQDVGRYATKKRLPLNDFALNHYGEPDVALFDFTSIYTAVNASQVLERYNRRLLCQLVGDSLAEPFWPTGTGCARGFLSALDAAWALRTWGAQPPPNTLDLLAQRESVYRLFSQATAYNTSQEYDYFTIDPSTRYKAFEVVPLSWSDVFPYYVADVPVLFEDKRAPNRAEREVSQKAVLSWLGRPESRPVEAASRATLVAMLRRYRPDLLSRDDNLAEKSIYDVLHKSLGVACPFSTSDLENSEDNGKILEYLRDVFYKLKGDVPHVEYTNVNLYDQLNINKVIAKVTADAEIPAGPSNVSESERSHASRKKRRCVRSAHVSTAPSAKSVAQKKVNHKTAEREKIAEQVATLKVQIKPPKSKSPNFTTKRLKRGIPHPNPFTAWDPLKNATSLTKNTPTSVDSTLIQQKAIEFLAKVKEKRDTKAKETPKYRTMTRGQRFKQVVKMMELRNKQCQKTVDLEKDADLQTYRAEAPEFMERVRDIESKLLKNDNSHMVGRACKGSGGLVAQLAAGLATPVTADRSAKPNKPKDLLRAVGKIDKGDWNIREIEKKITENRLGRPEPRGAERVPKWNRDQFLYRQKKLKEGDTNNEKWEQIDRAVSKVEKKLRDAGLPDHGTQKVANLATMFTKPKQEPSVELKKAACAQGRTWAQSGGSSCAVCGGRVFAAERVIADGLHLHRACFRCAHCKAVLRPGSYITEANGSRLVCLRHTNQSVPDAAALAPPKTFMQQVVAQAPERISVESCRETAKEIDEDEWTDRNFLLSETSGPDGLSDEEESTASSSSDESDSESPLEEAEPSPRAHFEPLRDYSDESYGYDNTTESCEAHDDNSSIRMHEAVKAHRLALPASPRPATDTSEMESENTYSSDDDSSSATGVSTDSEFVREENTKPVSPPAILVTEVPTRSPPALQDYPLNRTRSAGGLATRRALELKRKYLFGEETTSPVKKSDSTSRLDSKIQAIQSNITEFQKLLNPATADGSTYETTEKRISHSIKQYYDTPRIINDETRRAEVSDEAAVTVKEAIIEDEHSDNVTQKTVVPKLEVHNEIGVLIESNDSFEDNTLVNKDVSPKCDQDLQVVAATESDTSRSVAGPASVGFTDTELSDCLAESAVLDESSFGEKFDNHSSHNQRSLNKPKTIIDATNVAALPSHVCGKNSPDQTNIGETDSFQFVDDDEQDLLTDSLFNKGYMEIVDEKSQNVDITNTSDTAVNNNPTNGYPEEGDCQTSQIANDQKTSQIETKNVDDLASPQLIIFMDHNKNANDLSCKATKSVIKLENIDSGNGNQNCVSDKLDLSTLSPPLDSEDSKTVPADVNKTMFEIKTDKHINANSSPLAPCPYFTPSNSNPFAKQKFNKFNFTDISSKVDEVRREREIQTEVVKKLVFSKLGAENKMPRSKSIRGPKIVRALVESPPPVPEPPIMDSPLPSPTIALTKVQAQTSYPVSPSFSNPELSGTRKKGGLMRSISSYFLRRRPARSGGSCENTPPPVPPLPARYSPTIVQSPQTTSTSLPRCQSSNEQCARDERLRLEARWSRLVSQRRVREARTSPALPQFERQCSRPVADIIHSP